MNDPTQSLHWKALENHCSSLRKISLRDLLFEDPKRTESLTFELGNLFVDFSKQMVTEETIDLLVALANDLDLNNRIGELINGEPLNVSENRPALHTALRCPEGDITVDGENVIPLIRSALEKSFTAAEKIRSGQWLGVTGDQIKAVVNIGIGGSHLGPAMVVSALSGYCDNDVRIRFVSNIDPSSLDTELRSLDPRTTLFIINSKSFHTAETLANAHAAFQWAQDGLDGSAEVIKKHFVAITANQDVAENFGIPAENIFPTWDWVGGRFSICSPVSFSAMIAVGSENFQSILNGCYKIDNHFRATDLKANVPALMGMIAVWNRNFLGHTNHAVVPYSTDLHKFPLYLQQLEMESNGKHVREDGSRVSTKTSPIILSGVGTDAQHSFFQFLHQGTEVIPVDFIAFSNPSLSSGSLDRELVSRQHQALLANCFAQSKALAIGSESSTETFSSDGNRPNTTVLGTHLDPFTLGQLIALYEHKVFTMGVLWRINSFDQWGVQFGKLLAETISNDLDNPTGFSDHDSSTKSLLARYQKSREI